MIKLVCFFRRKPGVTRENFHRHWLENHGPLIAENPSLARHLERYEQNHRLDADYERADPCDFDGATVQWLESMKSFRAFIEEPDYAKLIAPDEERFIDRSSLTLIFTGEEDIKKDGGAAQHTAPAKLLGLLKRKPELTPAEFHRHWATQHARVVLGAPDFDRHMLAYHQNHRSEKDYVRDVDAAGYDGLAEVWFASAGSFAEMSASPAYGEVIAPDEELFIDRRAMTFILSGTPDVIVG
jgi:uncharacterized protein (TIGR02118 family)